VEGGLFYWGPRRICKGRLWKRASLSIGATLGNLEGRLVYRRIRNKKKKENSVLIVLIGSKTNFRP
jgi:hypothetical protein